MEQFDISYDETGKPVYVNLDNGFIQTGRKFDPETDGWMLEQLNPDNFPAIRIGHDTEDLVNEVNYLRRRVWTLERSEKQWMTAAGFGPSKPEPSPMKQQQNSQSGLT